MRELATKLLESGKVLIVCDPTPAVVLPPRWERRPALTVSFDTSKTETICSLHGISSTSSDPADAAARIFIPWAMVRAVIEADSELPHDGPYRAPAEAAAPSRKLTMRALLERAGTANVQLDARRPNVRVPPVHEQAKNLTLTVGYRGMGAVIPDLFLGNHGMVCTLRFGGEPFRCEIPWEAVFAIVGPDGRGVVWEEAMPPDLHAPSERASVQPSAARKTSAVEIATTLARYECTRRRQPQMTMEHLLASLLYDDVTAFVLEHSGARVAELEQALAAHLDGSMAGATATSAPPTTHPDLLRVLRRASRSAARDRAAELTGRHVLIALLAETQSVARRLLLESGLDPKALPSEDLLLSRRRSALPLPGTRIIVHNDDRSTMKFVVGVFETHFAMSHTRAVHHMLSVHHRGRCALGPYEREEALAKIEQVLRHAKESGMPLRLTLEES